MAADRRTFRMHWAVYDSQVNLPVIYMMEIEDTGRTALPKDQRRWPEVQAHLMAQALGGLKLVTIAKGFDEDFDDLHPKRLRRIHVGPMYSSAFTQQAGPISQVLEAARAPEGQDWALVWTEEDLLSERVRPNARAGFQALRAGFCARSLCRSRGGNWDHAHGAVHRSAAASLSGAGRIRPTRLRHCAQVRGQPGWSCIEVLTGRFGFFVSSIAPSAGLFAGPQKRIGHEPNI